MTLTVRWLCVAVILCLPSMAGAAENQGDKNTDIEKLMSMTGALSLGHQVQNMLSTAMIEGLKKSNPNVPTRAFDILREELEKAVLASRPELVNRLIAIYGSHFTHEDIKGLISFYEGPLGKKVIATLPTVMQESLKASREWAESLRPLLEEGLKTRLREEGISP